MLWVSSKSSNACRVFTFVKRKWRLANKIKAQTMLWVHLPWSHQVSDSNDRYNLHTATEKGFPSGFASHHESDWITREHFQNWFLSWIGWSSHKYWSLNRFGYLLVSFSSPIRHLSFDEWVNESKWPKPMAIHLLAPGKWIGWPR